MTVHTVSDTNPTRVTGADQYRISFTRLLTPEHPTFKQMEEFFLPEHRHPHGYGLAFLESEEHSLLYVGTVHQIEEHRAAHGTVPLDITQGAVYEFWPQSDGWADYLPGNTWHPDGLGILATFPHPQGGEVIVYEFHGSWFKDRPARPLVTFHCTNCHADTFRDLGNVHENDGPDARRWAARQARKHVHSVGREHSECRKTNPALSRMAAAVASEMFGSPQPEIAWESRCATTGPCAEIRHLRARTTG